MYRKTIVELGAGLRAGEFSSEELTRSLLERINRLDGQLNTTITVVA